MSEREESIEAKAGTDEREAAMSLLGMIARAEQWWGPDEKLPSRRDILSAYSDCVVAVRGGYEIPDHAPETASKPEPVSAMPIVEEAPVGPSPAAIGGAALYAAVRDLAPANEIAVNENQAAPELLVVNGHISLDA